MKSLIATVLLLSSIITVSLLNLHYVNATVEDLEEMLDRLPALNDPECIERSREIEEYWEERKTLIALTVSYPLVDRIGEQAALLASGARTKDLYGFESAKTLFYDALSDLGRAEHPSVKHLL